MTKILYCLFEIRRRLLKGNKVGITARELMENGKLREEVERVFESWKKLEGNSMNPGIYLYLAKLTCSW